eukprot:2610298-Amphidinium_carterae.1
MKLFTAVTTRSIRTIPRTRTKRISLELRSIRESVPVFPCEVLPCKHHDAPDRLEPPQPQNNQSRQKVGQKWVFK